MRLRTLAFGLAAVLAIAPATALAKQKRPPAPRADGEARKPGDKNERPPPPGDKGTNEGARGRTNATEDAAGQADSPQWQRRP